MVATLRDSDLKPVCLLSLTLSLYGPRRVYPLLRFQGMELTMALQVFRALQTAYIQLLQNPFYLPDDYIPAAKTMLPLSPYLQITNRKFIADIRRIGESWNAGVMMSV